jgi:hypothetical protein
MAIWRFCHAGAPHGRIGEMDDYSPMRQIGRSADRQIGRSADRQIANAADG